ncbi:MAG: hypothetical protein KGS28_13525 [Betaproteobacteria bacterium]|nr:hypothetical protein [Betaproteobacteria bacterium]
MSYYAYSPQTVADTRTHILLSVEDFLNEEFMTQTFEKVPPGKELAIHSDLRMSTDKRRHLVMVDMSTSSKAHLQKLRAFLGDNFFQRIAWFSSGRSFHGYGETLLEVEEWVHFMGLLLLANQPRLEPTVDPRWIGHRLLAGYSSLRWTCNTAHYISLPKGIDLVRSASSPKVERCAGGMPTDKPPRRLS